MTDTAMVATVVLWLVVLLVGLIGIGYEGKKNDHKVDTKQTPDSLEGEK